MGPKKYTLNEIGALIVQNNKKLDELSSLVKGTQASIAKVNTNCLSLTGAVQNQARLLNQLEQDQKNNTIRITGLKLNQTKIKNNVYIKHETYEQVMRPILETALEHEDIDEIVTKHILLRDAFAIANKTNGKSTPTIVATLNITDYRYALFKHRKTLTERGIFIFDNLTKPNQAALKNLKSNYSKAFSMSGKIFYTDESGLTTAAHNVFDEISDDDETKRGMYPTWDLPEPDETPDDDDEEA